MAIPLITNSLLQSAQLNQNTLMRNWMRLVNNIPAAVNTNLLDIENQIDALQDEIDAISVNVFEPLNVSFTATAASNILTFTLTDWSGNSFTSDNKGIIPFRRSNILLADVQAVEITAPISISTIVGATQGVAANCPFKIWLLAFYDGTNIYLALFQSISGMAVGGANPTGWNTFTVDGLASTIAISAGATSGGVFYTPAGVTLASKPYRVIGYVEYNAGLATPGTYNSNPTSRAIYGPGVKLPGERIQSRAFGTGIQFNTTNVVFQTTNVLVGITPKFASNLIIARAYSSIFNRDNTGTSQAFAQIFRNTPATAIGNIGDGFAGASTVISYFAAEAYDLPGVTTALQYEIRLRSAGGANMGLPDGGNLAYIYCDEMVT